MSDIKKESAEFEKEYSKCCHEDCECPVCGDKEKLKGLNCGHYVCKEDIWVILELDNQCPLCKKTIEKYGCGEEIIDVSNKQQIKEEQQKLISESYNILRELATKFTPKITNYIVDENINPGGLDSLYTDLEDVLEEAKDTEMKDNKNEDWVTFKNENPQSKNVMTIKKGERYLYGLHNLKLLYPYEEPEQYEEQITGGKNKKTKKSRKSKKTKKSRKSKKQKNKKNLENQKKSRKSKKTKKSRKTI